MENVFNYAYTLKLGEKVKNYPSNNEQEILIRVPGGWVYIYGDMQGTTSSFIAFNNEFLTNETSGELW